jgi:hypothetical protein
MKSMIQQRPKDEEVKSFYYRKLSDYSVKIFQGYELHATEPDILGDYKHVKFFDKTVESKIEDNKYYKCWYDYSEARDPADRNVFYYFAYVEEVPDEIVKIIESQKIFAKYMKEK